MNESKGLSKALVANFAAFALTALAGLAVNLMGARFYSAEVMGVFNQALAVFIFGGQMAALGFQYSVVHFVSVHRDQRGRASFEALSALSLTAICAVLVSLLVHLLAPFLAHKLGSQPLKASIESVAWGLFFFALNKTLMGAVSGFFKMGAFAFFTGLRALFIISIFCFFTFGLDTRPARLIEIFCLAEGLLFICLLSYFFRRANLGLYWFGSFDYRNFGILPSL